MKKNLRKLLGLVLVFAMVLSVSAIGASAAFTDTSKSKYNEAIDVLSGLGVINGATSTTFNPTGSLTREGAAKIITYLMLGSTNASMIQNAATQRFSDVPTSRWSSGYIDYCASQGYIVGGGDGKFNPEGTLTTVAFTKLLLCALGYDPARYTGTNWSINVASDAFSAGINDSAIVISNTAVCTREQAAQLAFLTLTGTMVSYTGGSTVTVGGISVVTGATRSDVPNNITGSDYNGGSNDKLMQFCEKYFPKLTLTVSSPDSFQRPAHKWMNNNTTIGVYADPAVVTYTASTLATKVASDLNGYTLGGKNIENYTTYEYNLVPDDPNMANNFTISGIEKLNGGAATLSVADAYDETLAAALAGETGNGKVVEIYADPNRVITDIIVTKYSVGTISNVVTGTNGTTYSLATPLGVGDGSFINYTDDKLFNDTMHTSAALAKGDVVTYVKVNNEAWVYPTTTVTGVATNVSYAYGTPTVTIGGTSYTAAVASNVLNASTFTAGTLSASYYIDQFGYLVLTTASAASTNYVYLVGKYGTISSDANGTVPTAQVKVVKADGTVAVYNLSLTKLTAYSTEVTTPTAAANNPAGATLDMDTSSPLDGSNDAVKLAAGDYIITGTNILVYDASRTTNNTAGLNGTVDFAVRSLADVYGYTLADTTIKLETLGTTMGTGKVAFDTAVSGVGYGKSTGTGSLGTSLMNASTIYVVYDSSKNTATVYTGVNGLPAGATVDNIKARNHDSFGAEIAANANVVMTGINGTAGTASYVFLSIDAPFTSVSTTNMVYISTATYGSSQNAAGAMVYTYTGTKADGTTVSLTSTGATLALSGLYTFNADNTVSDLNRQATNTNNTATDYTTNGIFFSSKLTVWGSTLSSTDASNNIHYYNITSDTKTVYINPTLSTVDDNGGCVILARDAANHLTDNVATIYVTAD